jgi:transposase
MFRQQYNGSEIRKSILLYEKIQSFRKVANIVNISKSTIHRWYNRFHRVLLTSKKRKMKKKKRKSKYPTLESDLKTIFARPDLKFLSLQQILHTLNYRPSLSTLAVALKNAKISRRRFSQTMKVKGNISIERINEFKEKYNSIPFESIICIDETGFSNIGNVYYGYFNKGKQPEYSITKTKQRRSCIMAISSNSIIHYKVQEKAYNTTTFCQFIKELLDKLPETITTLVMDNISFHKSKFVKDLVNEKNINILFIPPYSPQYDPIEEVFAQIKKSYRSHLLNGHNIDTSIQNSVNDIKTRPHVFLGSYIHTHQHCKK